MTLHTGAPADGSPESGRAPVMSDVARLAGVSHQTVSRVLNHHPSVRTETRLRVRAAISELGYRPNRIARALASRSFRSVGVVTTDTLAHGPASTLLGIERAARDRGWGLAIAAPTRLTGQAMLEAIEALLDQGVGGLLVIAPQDAVARALPSGSSGLPVLWVAGPDPAGGGTARSGAVALPTVRVDQVEGARLATEHLLALGHRTVWHICGPTDWEEARSRVAGWQRQLRAAGAPVPPVAVGNWDANSGYQVGRELVRRGNVTAVFAANDEMAIGLLRAVAEAGLRCPQDISVVGFDDIPLAAFAVAPLTTVRQDFDELGRAAVSELARLIGRSPAADHLPLPPASLTPQLVVRASTGPPPRRC